MKTTYTPGPWEVRYPSTSWAAIAPVGMMKQVAEVFYDYHRTKLELSPVDHANARLIAAAPELLAALQELIADASAMDARLLTGQPDPKCEKGSISRARDAITKATKADI